jgi:UDP-N-acetylmuramate--alanine ligase
VLQEAGMDPTLIVGGKLKSLKTNAKLGTGRYLVVEADEFDRSFLQLTPFIAVITNIETEHLDCYADLTEIKNAFITYANQVPFYGSVILCLDEGSLQDIIPHLKRKIVTYGLTPQAEVRAESPVFDSGHSSYTAWYKKDKLGEIGLQLPGIHNIRNSLAALAAGIELEIPFTIIKKALENFTGVHRRFEIKLDNDIMVVDDYAHHPTEIQATLQAARTGWNRRIIAVFQPHLYSRTRDFYHDFGKSFFDADILIVTEIYAARENPIEGVTGKMIAGEAQSLGHRNAKFIADKNDVAGYLFNMVQPGDMVITMGAGDIWKSGESLIGKLKKQ